jgi:antitoxin HicB
MSEKNLNYYMNLPYKIEITPEEDGIGFNAVILDLKGCMAFGETIEEVYETIIEVKQAWLEIALERGWQIPEPPPAEFKEYSGRFNVRLPRYLHRELSEMAEGEETSLNQLVVAFLSEGAERQRQKRWSVQYEKAQAIYLGEGVAIAKGVSYADIGATVYVGTGEYTEFYRPVPPPVIRGIEQTISHDYEALTD